MRPTVVFVVPMVAMGLACASLTRSATRGFADDIYLAIVNQDDPETVRDGAPAYLLALDGLIEGSPEDLELLLSGARLYAAYASAFVDDPVRARRMWNRGFDYARRALCGELRDVCEATRGPFEVFASALDGVGAGDLATLYGFGSAWAGWSQAHADQWGVVADIPKVEAVMERVVMLDDAHDGGAAHLYLGVLYTQRPASLGGRPERGRAHFERAIEISERRNLMAQVFFARQYARLVFDRSLHDRLLREVIDADPREPGLTLSNTIAQARAAELLSDADEYF